MDNFSRNTIPSPSVLSRFLFFSFWFYYYYYFPLIIFSIFELYQKFMVDFMHVVINEIILLMHSSFSYDQWLMDVDPSLGHLVPHSNNFNYYIFTPISCYIVCPKPILFLYNKKVKNLMKPGIPYERFG